MLNHEIEAKETAGFTKAARRSSGLIETKESKIGFLFDMRCATIMHAHRYHI
jgi:hypothetical protein